MHAVLQQIQAPFETMILGRRLQKKSSMYKGHRYLSDLRKHINKMTSA